MAFAERPILFDADSLIRLLGWENNYFGKVRKALGAKFCVVEYVAKSEVTHYVDRNTGKRIPVDLTYLSSDTVPRLVSESNLSDEAHAKYLQYFESLSAAGPGERPTFAMAWALEYDVCSEDTDAHDLFRQHRPPGCQSKHFTLLQLLRELKVLS